MLTPLNSRKFISDTHQETLDVSDVEDLIRIVAEFIGVPSERLRNRRTLDTVRPYRHAIWFILSNDFDISHRWMAEYFQCSRNTIKNGVNQFKDPDAAHIVALKLVRAKLNRVSTGV